MSERAGDAAAGCAACQVKRRHSRPEMLEFHPLAGHGFAGNIGWTHPDAEAAANERAVRSLARSIAEVSASAPTS